MRDGFAKIPRALLDTDAYKRGFTDRKLHSLLLWLFLHANWGDGEFMGVPIKRGQIAMSCVQVARWINVSEPTLRRMLKSLEKEGIISISVAAAKKPNDGAIWRGKMTRQFTLISLLISDTCESKKSEGDGAFWRGNLAALEDNIDQRDLDICAGEPARPCPRQDSQPAHDTVEAETSRAPKVKPSVAHQEEVFARFWDAYDNKLDKQPALTVWKRLWRKGEIDDVKAEKVIAAAEKTRQLCESHGVEKRYRKRPKTWLNGRCWTDEEMLGFEQSLTESGRKSGGGGGNDGYFTEEL